MATTTPDRADIQALQGASPKLVRALEDLFGLGKSNSAAIEGITESTQGITDATVITLSPNAAFNNERVLQVLDPLAVVDGGPNGELSLGFSFPFTVSGGFALTLNLQSDTNVTLPSSGTLLTDAVIFPGPFASDSAAATGGVPLNGAYRFTDGTLHWRQA